MGFASHIALATETSALEQGIHRIPEQVLVRWQLPRQKMDSCLGQSYGLVKPCLPEIDAGIAAVSVGTHHDQSA